MNTCGLFKGTELVSLCCHESHSSFPYPVVAVHNPGLLESSRKVIIIIILIIDPTPYAKKSTGLYI